jgi:hypothetical protein
MRKVLNILGLRLDRKTYYNLMRSKPLKDKVLNDSFKGVMLALKKVGFHFACLINNELADDGSIKGRILK